jgi:outer membrane biosynthesis protein TonB
MTTLTVKRERNNRNAALIGTILFHALILLFLLWYVIITPIPPYPPPKNTPEVEVALDFGNNINGTGNVEAPNKGNNPMEDKTPDHTDAKPVQQASSTITSDIEANPAVNSSKQPGKVDVTPQPQPEHVSIDLAAAENKFKHSKGEPGGNGNSGTAGNAGSPNGTTPGVGNGNGGPFEFFLAGRGVTYRPTITNTSQDQGKVVVTITVDQDGKVVNAVPGARGSTTSSPYLFEKAKEAAYAAKFSKSPDGTPEQQGTITIVFVIQ